jgi:hypothetical protein
LIDTTPTGEEAAAAAEWKAAQQQLAELQEQIRKTGDVHPDDYASSYQRVEDAAAAITIPPHLVTFRPDDWPGRSVDHVGFTNDALRRREQWRQAQDRWCAQRKMWRGEFEELHTRQRAALTPQDRDSE